MSGRKNRVHGHRRKGGRLVAPMNQIEVGRVGGWRALP